nr:PREDICTED: histone-lysine N-methyltransferase SETD1B-like [Lepisosteus oculatus]
MEHPERGSGFKMKSLVLTFLFLVSFSNSVPVSEKHSRKARSSSFESMGGFAQGRLTKPVRSAFPYPVRYPVYRSQASALGHAPVPPLIVRPPIPPPPPAPRLPPIIIRQPAPPPPPPRLPPIIISPPAPPPPAPRLPPIIIRAPAPPPPVPQLPPIIVPVLVEVEMGVEEVEVAEMVEDLADMGMEVVEDMGMGEEDMGVGEMVEELLDTGVGEEAMGEVADLEVLGVDTGL